MNEHDLAGLLHAAGNGVPVAAAPTDRILAAGRRRVRTRWVAEVLATVAVVAAVLVPIGLGQRTPAPAVDPVGCAAMLPRVLPEWARGGFSPPDQPTPYVLGERGEIAAIPFGPLTSPPEPGRTNKILWVARTPAAPGPLTISAHRSGEPPVVVEVADGPGPSVVDLPGPGCWILDLRWSGGSDTLDLRYVPGAES